MPNPKKIVILMLTTIFCLIFTDSSFGLQSEQILVVANRNARASIGLAKYYMEKRGIPEKNLLRLFVTDQEVCSRSEYDKKIAAPIRSYLTENFKDQEIRALLLISGVPLKIKSSDEHRSPTPKNDLAEANEKETASKQLQNGNRASVDSELALLKVEAYPLAGWLKNPLYLGNRNTVLPIERQQIMLVSRLDGPSEDIVRRLIDQSLLAEQQGLNGVAYFDARWPFPKNKELSAYAMYDKAIHLTAQTIRKSKRLPVVLEESKTLFQPGDCPDAALYCGWYSIAKYVDAFAWQPGAIGYHIASSECQTLRKKGSTVWCKMMLEKGISATIGPVYEPFVQAYPLPQLFFGLLFKGLSLAEAYSLSTPYLSWQMVLIGDPLYRPFSSPPVNLPNRPTD